MWLKGKLSLIKIKCVGGGLNCKYNPQLLVAQPLAFIACCWWFLWIIPFHVYKKCGINYKAGFHQYAYIVGFTELLARHSTSSSKLASFPRRSNSKYFCFHGRSSELPYQDLHAAFPWVKTLNSRWQLLREGPSGPRWMMSSKACYWILLFIYSS